MINAELHCTFLNFFLCSLADLNDPVETGDHLVIESNAFRLLQEFHSQSKNDILVLDICLIADLDAVIGNGIRILGKFRVIFCDQGNDCRTAFLCQFRSIHGLRRAAAQGHAEGQRVFAEHRRLYTVEFIGGDVID